MGQLWRLLLGTLALAAPHWWGFAQSDDFAGTGPLIGFTTNNESALPDVQRVDGRYRANLIDNTGNRTLHFNDEQGRLDAKLVRFPFEFTARNIGIGTQADSQSAPIPQGDLYIFSGVQVHVPELESRNSSHVVVGHRGGTHFTIEGKNTVNSSSFVNDDGFNALPDGRADVRIVGNEDHTLTVYWQQPNLTGDPANDSFQLYRGDGRLPGTAPAYGEEVYVGIITYAFGQNGIPFVGTCDGIEIISVPANEEPVVLDSPGIRFSQKPAGSEVGVLVGPIVSGMSYILQKSANGVNGWEQVDSLAAVEFLDEHQFVDSQGNLDTSMFYRVLVTDE